MSSTETVMEMVPSPSFPVPTTLPVTGRLTPIGSRVDKYNHNKIIVE